MKKDKISLIFLFSLMLFLISFGIGYGLMNSSLDNRKVSELDKVNIEEDVEKSLEILKNENIVTPNTFIEERINYFSCSHVATSSRPVEENMVNMTKDEFSDYLYENYPNQRIISFSQSKIVIGVNKNHLCENHYVIGEKNGVIAIYKIGESGDRILINIFEDYPISILMDMDQEKIKEGIVVDSEEELSTILENFIS